MRVHGKVQVIEKEAPDDNISTFNPPVPKPPPFRLVLMRSMLSNEELANDSLVTKITMNMKIHERMGEDRRWSIKRKSALA
jgi:hypothetical protein